MFIASPAGPRRNYCSAPPALRTASFALLSLIAFCAIDSHAAQNEAAAREDQAVQPILRRAAAFVRDLHDQLNGVIADEAYEQSVRNPLADAANGSRRAIRSEVLFMTLADIPDLVFVRTVLVVNGRKVPDSTERLDRLFNDPPANPSAYLMQLKQESARFNIGAVLRTTGDPAFALRFLDPKIVPRFVFTRAGVERIGVYDAVKLAFAEQDYPTLIAVNGINVPASGDVWVNAADGTLLRTNVKVSTPDGNASVTVDFQRDARLQQWVPSRMAEVYGAGTTQETRCTATYSNYRRFDSTVRISTP
jgi:hypothetical protein